MAANTVLLATPYLIVFCIVVVAIKGALVDAHLALNTTLRVSFY
jgi:hypothetical protein